MKNKEYYKKLIVVDFDDTLCIHQNGSTSNIMKGAPNKDLIGRLQYLHREGYNIEIHTARGHFSCDSREEAERKHGPVIEAWLKKYNVPYNKIDFNKPYGIIYIDDKAMRPNELELIKGL
jgi:capsule biosynthesis phosphatase